PRTGAGPRERAAPRAARAPGLGERAARAAGSGQPVPRRDPRRASARRDGRRVLPPRPATARVPADARPAGGRSRQPGAAHPALAAAVAVPALVGEAAVRRRLDGRARGVPHRDPGPPRGAVPRAARAAAAAAGRLAPDLRAARPAALRPLPRPLRRETAPDRLLLRLLR